MSLKKSLSLLDVFCLAAGAMISSGIFILPGLAYSLTGPIVFLSYFLAGVLALIGVLSVIELATAMPKAGGDYYYVTRSMGPMIGTVSGLLSWFALTLKSAFAIYGMAEVTHLLIGGPVVLYGLIFTIIFIILNIVGVNEAAKLETALVIGLLVLLSAYVAVGMPQLNVRRFEPFFIPGKNIFDLLSTAGFVFVAFGGLLNIASVSEEMKNPKRDIPLALMLSVSLITILYTLTLIATVGVLDGESLAKSLTPIADCARIIIGTPGFVVVTIAAFLAFVTTANAGVMAASRYPLALGRDNLIPAIFAKVSERSETPVVAIFLTGLLIVVSLLMPLEILVKAASTVILTAYVLSSLSVIILRESRIQNYKPSFRSPFYPYLQIFGIVVFSFLIIDMGLGSIEISLTLIVISLIVYWFYGKRVSREYALLHVLERITDRKLTSYDLQQELHEVIRDRDQIVKDEFDHLVEDALFLDFDEGMTADQLFENVMDQLTQKVERFNDVPLVSMLREREELGGTVISPFVAIPHVILDGEDYFGMVVVRCKGGIVFGPASQDDSQPDESRSFQVDKSNVQAVFMVMGTMDRRNFHLRCLAAIAQIIQSRDFESKWLAAKSLDELRDLLLLSKRKRQ